MRENLTVARWGIFALLIVMYILVYFHRMAPAVVSRDLMGAFQTTGTALGSLAAMYFYIYAAMQIPAGVLADTLGSRIAVTLGGLTAGVGSLMFGLAPTLAFASVGRFLVGLGVSVVFVSTMKSNSLWFRERDYGFISGLTLFIGNMGSVLSAGPLAALLNVASWRTVFVWIGGISLLFAALTYLFVRNKPEDYGFPSMRELDGHAPLPPREHHWLKELGSVMRVRAVWPGFLITFGMTGGLYAFMGLWGVPYLRDVHGLDRSGSAGYMTVMLLAFAVGALALGMLSDRMGKRKPILILSTVVNTVVWIAFALLPVKTGFLLYVIFALLGFTGAGFVLAFACAKEVCNPMLSGMAVAVVNIGTFIGTSLLQPLFGYVLDVSWSGTMLDGVRVYMPSDYAGGLFLLAGVAVAGVVGALLTTETYCRNISGK